MIHLVWVVPFLLFFVGFFAMGLNTPLEAPEGERSTPRERLALLLAAIVSPLLWLLAICSGFAAILLVPCFAVALPLCTAVAARTLRPLAVGFLASLPFAFEFVIVFALFGRPAEEVDFREFGILLLIFVGGWLGGCLPLQLAVAYRLAKGRGQTGGRV